VFELIERQYTDYEVICTGHSLGAAVSSLLAFLIKTRDETRLGDKTVAVCYSTPGCIISKEAISYFKTFCTSVVLGDDFICRLTPRNVHILREKIKVELEHCHVKKFNLITSEIMDKLFSREYRPSNLPSMVEVVHEPSVDVDPAYIPGNVLHFIRSATTTTNINTNRVSEMEDGLLEQENRDDGFEPVWVDPGSFHEILVSTSMAMDHLPNRVGNVLRSFCESF
jgi:hypothetical protein